MSGFAWKKLTPESLQTSIEAMREHLIAKNVAADVAGKICQSIFMKLFDVKLSFSANRMLILSTHGETDRHTDTQTGIETDRLTDRQTHTKTHRQTDTWTDR